jgi:Ca2+-binding RTX toxin-like protein
MIVCVEPVEVIPAEEPVQPLHSFGPYLRAWRSAGETPNLRTPRVRSRVLIRKESIVAVRPWLKDFRAKLIRSTSTYSRRPHRLRNGVSQLSSGATGRVLENLEDRTLLAASVLFGLGELQILTDGDETVTVREDPIIPGQVDVQIGTSLTAATTAPSLPNVAASDVTSIVLITGAGNNTIDLSGVLGSVFTNLSTINVQAGNGDDVIIGSTDLAISADGQDGDDSITGGSADDTLDGGDGADTIAGLAGNDSIDAGDGDDVVSGGDGDDTILADDGNDTVTGDLGNDNIRGGDGLDSVSGNEGLDTLNGNSGNDTISGDDGVDLIFGGGGDDQVSGGPEGDTIIGNSGADTLSGDDGADFIDGGNSNDSLLGGDGDDTVNGMAGNDTIDGEAGNDTLAGGAGDDRIIGDTESVVAQLFGNDVILGQSGNDTLIGTLGADTITGGTGDDLIQSTIEVVNLVAPPVPPPPVAPPTSPGTIDTPLDDAVGPMGTNPLGMSAILSTGTGDFSLQVTIDGDGTATNVTFDPSGTVAQTSNVVFVPEVYRIAVDGAAFQTLTSTGVALTGDGTGATSSFSQAGLNFALTQQVEPFQQNLTNSMGAMLTQSYQVTNPGTAAVTFEFARTTHYHTGFPGGFSEGAGRFFDQDGVEILVQTQNASLPTTLGNFVGITSLSGDALSSNRFEINLSPNGFNPPLNDTVFDDPDMDGFSNSTGHVGMGLRSQFMIPPGASVTYTQHLIVASANFQPPNIPPVAAPESATTFGTAPVTVDVVSNDTDADGVVIFSTVAIVTPPANGTAVSLGNGFVQYTSNQGFSGTDVFDYVILDNSGAASNPATVTITVNAGDEIGDSLDGGLGDDTIIGGAGNDFINGRSGNDSLDGAGGNDTSLGGSGNDTLSGGFGNDTLDGQGGNDVVNGDEGEDVIIFDGVGDGQDTVDGGSGSDTVRTTGRQGDDTFIISQDADGLLQIGQGTAFVVLMPSTIQTTIVNGAAGDDFIQIQDLTRVGRTVLIVNGGVGDDILDAGGADTGSVILELNGNEGQDTIGGGLQNDRINGGAGDDSMTGAAGRDTISGGDGQDEAFGGLGDDLILGDAGNDTLAGDDGDDVIDGGLDNDVATGGNGDDTIRGNFGNDALNGMAGNDSILGLSGRDTLAGGSGDDTLDGGREDDRIRGHSGNDLIRGDHGDDFITGDAGNDEIIGEDGDDTIMGGDGADGIAGGDGDDFIEGQGMNDTITGGDGNDSLGGGGGNDTLLGEQGDDAINGNSGTDTAATGEGSDSVPTEIEILDESFMLDSAMQMNLDGL